MTKPKYIEISWTSGSLDEARKIARHLVQNRLVACAQITPWLESIYIWNDELETTQESRVVLKTTMELYDTVQKAIREQCTYEVPEIIYRAIDGGDGAYLEWLQNQVDKITG